MKSERKKIGPDAKAESAERFAEVGLLCGLAVLVILAVASLLR